jgi:hypothetical protein
MVLTTAQQVRLKIQDIPTLVDATYVGDGSASAFLLPHRNITSGSAFVMGAGTWTSTGATFNASGMVSFSGTISANTAFRTTYVQSVFSDDEIGHFTAVGGSVNGAALEAVHSLMFDSLKRARWMAPDGSQYDDTMAIQQLRDLYSALKTELVGEAIAAGSIQSWSLSQGDY